LYFGTLNVTYIGYALAFVHIRDSNLLGHSLHGGKVDFMKNTTIIDINFGAALSLLLGLDITHGPVSFDLVKNVYSEETDRYGRTFKEASGKEDSDMSWRLGIMFDITS